MSLFTQCIYVFFIILRTKPIISVSGYYLYWGQFFHCEVRNESKQFYLGQMK